MSSSKNREPGILIQGIHGRYELAEKLGNGGNGDVYAVNLIDVDESFALSDEYVIKRLNLAHVSDENERSKRKQRFWREISNVQQLQEQVHGILPIYDHSDSIAERDIDNWYLMPRAKPYYFGQRVDPEKILLDAISIGRTLQQIHNSGRAHRDIKPTNILFYKRRPVISDFGLVWRDNDVSITESGEHIGPGAIRPPELEYIHNMDLDTDDYFCSDVYMFAKTIWIFLTGNRYGFRGEYTRGNTGIYLKDNIIYPPLCLEPLNIMLERATKNEPSQRCSLEACIVLLKEEIDIIQGSISPQLLGQYMFDESIVESQSKIESSEIIYNDAHGIISIISKLQGLAYAVITEYEAEYNIGVVQSIEYFGGHNYILRLKQNPKPGKAYNVMTLYVGIEHISISKNKKCSIKMAKPTIFGDEIPRSSNIMAIAQMNYTQVVLNSELTINLYPISI